MELKEPVNVENQHVNTEPSSRKSRRGKEASPLCKKPCTFCSRVCPPELFRGTQWVCDDCILSKSDQIIGLVFLRGESEDGPW